MIKNYYFFAEWRKKDVNFLNSLQLNRVIEKGAFSFSIEEGEIYNKIINYFSKKDSLFGKTKPKDFYTVLSGVIFSKEELNQANNYVLPGIGKPKGFPQPKNLYKDDVYSDYCKLCNVYDRQFRPFRITKPNWAKNQVNFSLNWIFDAMFFKKDFFQEVLQPLGLKSREVIIHSTGKASEDTVQLAIPVAKSNLLIENTAYDTEKRCSQCGVKKYSQQTLDFFPLFEKEVDFLICKTQESFGETETQMAYRRIIISKEFCNLLVKHKVIQYNTYQIFPMKNN